MVLHSSPIPINPNIRQKKKKTSPKALSLATSSIIHGGDEDEIMKERQRWQPEEDALLRAYVKQYGPREWALVSQRMGQAIHRDPKSCLERWKNYLKPGLKKGSLSPAEQSLVVELQAKYGNKWKKIASELPGRTPKRLGKWWEVFREKQIKKQNKSTPTAVVGSGGGGCSQASSSSTPTEIASPPAQGPYDHILETFAEKYVQPNKLYILEPDPILAIGSGLPPWMNSTTTSSTTTTTTTTTTTSSTISPSVSLTLSSPLSDPGHHDPNLDPGRVGSFLVQWCKEVEEGRQGWLQHKKEATWRLSRLEQQLEAEKARKRREATEEFEAEIRRLREEEAAFVKRIENEYREEMCVLQRQAESKEVKLVEAWRSKHVKLNELVDRVGGGAHGFISPN